MKNIFKSALLTSAFFISLNAEVGFPKEYYKLPIAKAKIYFFDYFNKRIELENRKILEERTFIESLNRNKNLDKNSIEYKRLEKLQVKYKVKSIYNYNRFLERVDIIPPSMALAQAATESGWGKSRFFKKANNIFGHWTYNPRIGMLPLRRPAGKKHFIRIFPNLQASISAYMLNLNRTAAYYEFRLNRKQMRAKDTFINGMKLSSDMSKYSGIGHDYVKILQSIIRKNRLTTLDKKFYTKLKNEKQTNLNKQKEENEIHSTTKI